jgi:hypothetical protein
MPYFDILIYPLDEVNYFLPSKSTVLFGVLSGTEKLVTVAGLLQEFLWVLNASPVVIDCFFSGMQKICFPNFLK